MKEVTKICTEVELSKQIKKYRTEDKFIEQEELADKI